jgi:hypothetical protein
VEGRGVAKYKSAARDLGAFIFFEDEAGQGLSPPKGRTWAPRGCAARPAGGQHAEEDPVPAPPGYREGMPSASGWERPPEPGSEAAPMPDVILHPADAAKLTEMLSCISEWPALAASLGPGSVVPVSVRRRPRRLPGRQMHTP